MNNLSNEAMFGIFFATIISVYLLYLAYMLVRYPHSKAKRTFFTYHDRELTDREAIQLGLGKLGVSYTHAVVVEQTYSHRGSCFKDSYVIEYWTK